MILCFVVLSNPSQRTLAHKQAEIGDDPKEGCDALANALDREEQAP
jgi:hypothetical protein